MIKTMYSCVVKPCNSILTEAQQHRLCPKHRPTACSLWRRKEGHLKQEQLGDGDREGALLCGHLGQAPAQAGSPRAHSLGQALAPERSLSLLRPIPPPSPVCHLFWPNTPGAAECRVKQAASAPVCKTLPCRRGEAHESSYGDLFLSFSVLWLPASRNQLLTALQLPGCLLCLLLCVQKSRYITT